MSWLARSIARTLKVDDQDDAKDRNQNEFKTNTDKPTDEDQSPIKSTPSPESPGRGVKGDLSELSETLTRQFWGVASFLAPPPHSDPSKSPDWKPPGSTDSSDLGASDAVGIAGIRSDFAEIGGKFRTGISKLSNNIAVSEFTKMASNFLQLGSEGEEDYNWASGEAIAVTEEVLAFVRDISMHPETWLDFPLLEDEDGEDFDLSDAQQEHALSVERLVPQLAALRIELCPGYMSEAYFWKIYFVLLHPRLDRHGAELLTMTEIAKVRASLTQELQKRSKAKSEQDWISRTPSFSKDINNSPHGVSVSVPYASQPESLPLETSAPVTEKHPVLSTEIPIIDKSVIQKRHAVKKDNVCSGSSSSVLEEKEEDDGDDWLKEEGSEVVGASGTSILIENDEDVSFSDLEEEDGDVPTGYRRVTCSSNSTTKESRDWPQLSSCSTNSAKDIHSVKTTQCTRSEQVRAHISEAKDANGWLNVDDIDMS